ncbi:hypothetical protein ACT4R9_11330, partial [Ornithobacterium rhinotracheale]|uniref:hypothetical protein n=1 Tax=Ornithobacterium rhinotracheale TaxID=28251 RepID=UPI003FA42B5F
KPPIEPLSLEDDKKNRIINKRKTANCEKCVKNTRKKWIKNLEGKVRSTYICTPFETERLVH